MSFDDFISIYGPDRFDSRRKAAYFVSKLYSPSSWMIVRYGSYFYVVYASDFLRQEVIVDA